MIKFFVFCFLTYFSSVFSASGIEIETIIVDRNANIFINANINKGVEFTTDIVPVKGTEANGHDIRATDKYEYCKPQKSFYVKENPIKVILVRDLGGISYLICPYLGKEKENSLFQDGSLIKRIKDLINSNSIKKIDENTKNFEDYFMNMTGVNFLVKYNEFSSLSFVCGSSTVIGSPKRKQKNIWPGNKYGDFQETRKIRSEHLDASDIFIKHRTEKIEVDFATRQCYPLAFHLMICDVKLPQKRPFVFNTKKIISGIIIMGSIGVGFYYLRQYLQRKNKNSK